MIDKLLKFEEVSEITGLHKSSLYRKAHDETDPFPNYYTYGTRYARFKESESELWVNQLDYA